MELLYIEDETSKANRIIKELTSYSADIILQHEKSFTSGVIALRSKCFDLIILDMSLPLYDVGSLNYCKNDFETFAGIEILDEMLRLELKSKVIVITAFDILGDSNNQINLEQLDEIIRRDYGNNYLGIIHYNSSSLEWQRTLVEKMNSYKEFDYENTSC